MDIVLTRPNVVLRLSENKSVLSQWANAPISSSKTYHRLHLSHVISSYRTLQAWPISFFNRIYLQLWRISTHICNSPKKRGEMCNTKLWGERIKHWKSIAEGCLLLGVCKCVSVCVCMCVCVCAPASPSNLATRQKLTFSRCTEDWCVLFQTQNNGGSVVAADVCQFLEHAPLGLSWNANAMAKKHTKQHLSKKYF